MARRPINDKEAKENLARCRQDMEMIPNKYGITKAEAKVWVCAADTYGRNSGPSPYRSWGTYEVIADDVGACMKPYKSISNCNFLTNVMRKVYSEPEVLRCAMQKDKARAEKKLISNKAAIIQHKTAFDIDVNKDEGVLVYVNKQESMYNLLKEHFSTKIFSYDKIQDFFNNYIGVYNKEDIAASLIYYLSSNHSSFNITASSTGQINYLVTQSSSNSLMYDNENELANIMKLWTIIGSGLIGLCLGTGIGYYISKFCGKTEVMEDLEDNDIQIDVKINNYHIINQDENIVGADVDTNITLS